MTRDIPKMLGAAFRSLRKLSAGTQDEFSRRTGLSQSYVSALERGESGFSSFKMISKALEDVGVDPVELLRLAVANADDASEEVELRLLWADADPAVRAAILALLRRPGRTR